MPVQKRQCPTSDTAYDVRGEGSRYTLFCSSTVLQAGTNGSHEVLAVVTATGMATSRGQVMSSIIFPAPMVFKYDEELPIVIGLMVLYAIPCAAMGILCLDPGRVAISGKIRVFALDKTGTLTQAWLHFLGVQPVQSARAHTAHTGISMDAVQYLDKAGHIQTDSKLLWGLATCHAVSTSKVGGLVGNQVEVNMFSGTGWHLIEANGQAPRVEHPSDARQRLTITMVNEFEHARRSMSVVALDERSGELHVFCKGSFERVGQIVSQESVPSEYLQTGEQHASEGCYVLAMAHRCLGVVPVHQAAALSRNELEAGLDLLALLLFRNELKPDTAEAITQFKEGQVRPILVTGDSAHCAAYIGRACGMVAQHAGLLLADVDSSGDVNWSLMGSNRQDAKLQQSFTTAQVLEMQKQPKQTLLVELAVTGAAFDKLQQSEAVEQLLFFTRISARFAPQQKAEVVIMQQRAGLVVGMCGDGGNDCAALRAAHAGLALSDAEASLVSPFTSNNKSISSAVELIREGRCALHTRLACYKFLITYGLHFSVFNIAAFWYGIVLCQMVFISTDIFATIFLGYAVTLARPAKKLGRERPSSSLLGIQTMVSLLGIWILNVFFLVAAFCFMRNQAGYVLWPASLALEAEWWLLGDNWESSVLFFVVFYQYITCALVYSFGSSFRLGLLYNWALTVSITLAPPAPLASSPREKVLESFAEEGFPESPAMSFDFRIKLLALCLGNMLVIILWQKLIAEGLGSRALARIFPSKRVKLQM
ncbi:TPA: hypothetical protein ACH3X1_008117 [Trebouxia sp. C0004]